MIGKLKKNYNKILNILIVIFIINIIIYIFRGSRVWLNSDSAFFVDYSLEQIKTGAIFPAEWYHCNDFWIYSLIPLITIFIKIGFSLFLSRQFSVFIQSALFIFILIDLYKNCLNNKKGLMIILLLVLSGISGQFIFEMFGDATYGTIIFYMLLELWLYLKYLKTLKKRYVVFFGIILCFITACSLRFPVYIGAPIICCILFKFYSDKKIAKNGIWMLITICVSILIGFLLNKYMSSVVYINSTYSSDAYVSVDFLVRDQDGLAKSVKAVVYDYLSASGSTGRSVLSLNRTHYVDFSNDSPLIVLTFIRYIYAIVTIYIPFALIKKVKRMSDLEKSIYIYVSSLTFIILFFLLIGSMAWWNRYIIPVIFFLALLYPLYYKYCFASDESKKVVFHIFVVLFSITSFIFCLSSYFDFSKGDFRENYYDSISEFLLSKDLTLGYAVTSNECHIYRTLTNGKLQVLPLDYTAKYMIAWATSRDWYRSDYHDGKVFLMRQEGQDRTEIEDKAIETYEYAGVVISVFENNSVIIDNLY